MNVAISAAAETDLPVVLDLLLRSKLPRDGLEQYIATMLVAREGQRIVGCAVLEPYGGAALLRSVAVEPSCRGLGLGQQLTDAVLELARVRHIRTVYLLTETAANFFAKWGFQPVARSSVDGRVKGSIEFTKACPESAQAMRLEL